MQAVEQSAFELLPDNRVRLRLVDQYLDLQQQLSAVERFAQRHKADDPPLAGHLYEDLIPLSRPQKGQQYAFRVDLDACTGCKACVAACHSLNGLDQGEAWRSVGLLHGGTPEAPIQQTVTAACHHCVDPACLLGCPVRAYEKDPDTGIVRHLDDQCIGCQYCIFTCPYEVPQFNPTKGIVRKCDMCSSRLSAGEAPACVQACPNQAISIEIVDQKQAIEAAQAESFLPAAPSPAITVPTTTYTTRRPLPRNLLPADFYAVRPAQPHWPLVLMLVLTQLAVGAACLELVAERIFADFTSLSSATLSLLVLVTGIGAFAAATFHLGRPAYAFRALLGVKTSWMSREILAFSAFSMASVVHTVTHWQKGLLGALGIGPLPDSVARALMAVSGPLVVATGIAGLGCSVMVYAATGRRFWNGPFTAFRFTLTSLVLGSAVLVLVLSVLRSFDPAQASASVVQAFAVTTVVASATKLLGELLLFLALRRRRFDELKRAALLMKRELGPLTLSRFACGAVGGVVLGLALTEPLPSSLGMVVLSSAALFLCGAGELCERRLFFAAMTSPRMPGALR